MLGNVVLLRLQSDCDCLQEEERARREEEERLRRLEELEKQRQEQVGSVFYCCKQRCSLTPNSPQLTLQERLEQERREKKKQKEKERKERLKKEGKLLTKAQREARARAEATLKLLQAQGEGAGPEGFTDPLLSLPISEV